MFLFSVEFSDGFVLALDELCLGSCVAPVKELLGFPDFAFDGNSVVVNVFSLCV